MIATLVSCHEQFPTRMHAETGVCDCCEWCGWSPLHSLRDQPAAPPGKNRSWRLQNPSELLCSGQTAEPKRIRQCHSDSNCIIHLVVWCSSCRVIAPIVVEINWLEVKPFDFESRHFESIQLHNRKVFSRSNACTIRQIWPIVLSKNMSVITLLLVPVA